MHQNFVGKALQRILRLVPVALASICLGATGVAAQTDVIRGRVTNAEGLPLPEVQVRAVSIPGGVSREARTNPQGYFQIVFPNGTGDYMVGYGLIGYQYRQNQIKRLADEEVLIADTRLSIIQMDPVVVIAQNQERVSRNNLGLDITGTDQAVAAADLSPSANGDLAAMAASLPGVTLLPGLDGEASGFSVLGLGADDNTTTLNGVPVDANSLPRDAAISTALSTSTADVSRGGFSGGNLNVTSRPGSNFKSRGVSLVTTAPQVQWTDRAGQALGNEYTNLSLSGTTSGALALNKSFYNFSYQLGRQANDNLTLLNAGALGLQTAGVSADSVARFLAILQGRGIPSRAGPGHSDRFADNGSLLGSIDFSPPSSNTGQSVGITFNGSWNRTSPIGSGPTQLPSAAGDRIGWNGGVQVRHSGYLGLVLSETSAGLSASRNFVDPYLALSSGLVRVNSDDIGGATGVRSLTFGGSSNVSTTSSRGATFMNTLSWFDNANRHRIRFSTELQYQGSTREQASNLLGTFVFNSLADLEAGRASSYTRTLSAPERSSGQLTGAVSLGDAFRLRENFQLQYGIRLDGGGLLSTPARNEAIERVFGRRNDRLPTAFEVSPRLNFSWTVGRAQQIANFAGAAIVPRAVVTGGIGVYSNALGLEQFSGTLDNTGLPSGVQQLFCNGPAAPVPVWDSYLDDRSTIPTACADGTTGSVFANSSPNVNLIAEDYRPSRSVRSNLAWRGAILDARFNLSVTGTYSWNLGRSRTVDINFDPTQRFVLGDDQRPVFVSPSSIAPTTGSIASRDARVSSDFARVSETRSDLESRSAQLSFTLSPIIQGQRRYRWSTSYTYSDIREMLSGFSSTDGNPFDTRWARSAQGAHQINYTLSYNFFDAVQVSWNGSFRSGTSFTPMVGGDINGDGYSNDRAFVFSPTTGADAGLMADMQQLIDGASPSTRACLKRQIGTIAAPNSCRGPWSSNASLNITLDRAKFRMPQRGAISFSLSNPLGAADLLVNGSGNLKGWGQTVTPESSLLYVRGFNSQTQRYQYEVNQRFGETRPRSLTARSPVILTASVRLDLGPTRERQQLVQQLELGRKRPGTRVSEALLRSLGTSVILSPMGSILSGQDSLRLTTLQADSLASMNRRYLYRADSLWTPHVRYLSSLPNEFSESDAYRRFLSARRAQVDMLMEIGPAVRALLTPAQRRKLPTALTNYLDPRYLTLIRDGSRPYLAGSASSVGAQTFTVGGVGEAAVIRIAQ